MKVLWVCNIAMPEIAAGLGMEVSNKEGWLSGMARAVLENRQENRIELAIAFPASREACEKMDGICVATADIAGVSVNCYGFCEDTAHPHEYDNGLEDRLGKIVSLAEPDIVHCFGTEYPHTLAMCRVFPDKTRILIGLQGLCTYIAEAYFANLPEKVIRTKTLRDVLKRDWITRQQENFRKRGANEKAAVEIAGNITGRTRWDREKTNGWNPNARYYSMNESLRSEFYGPRWQADDCEPHSIFLSQGDYPLKGLHYMLQALPQIIKVYPDAKVYVAGNSLVAFGTLKEKLKISAYGRYLRQLIKKHHLEDHVEFTGRMNAEQMRDRYLKSNLFVCCSALENSPNSLGEAMLLGMPCVSADVGGVSSIFTGGEDGILYEGSGNLATAVLEMWGDTEKRKKYCENARKHALKTHDREANHRRVMEIYADMMARSLKPETEN